jgi:hypothetical protein
MINRINQQKNKRVNLNLKINKFLEKVDETNLSMRLLLKTLNTHMNRNDKFINQGIEETYPLITELEKNISKKNYFKRIFIQNSTNEDNYFILLEHQMFTINQGIAPAEEEIETINTFQTEYKKKYLDATNKSLNTLRQIINKKIKYTNITYKLLIVPVLLFFYLIYKHLKNSQYKTYVIKTGLCLFLVLCFLLYNERTLDKTTKEILSLEAYKKLLQKENITGPDYISIFEDIFLDKEKGKLDLLSTLLELELINNEDIQENEFFKTFIVLAEDIMQNNNIDDINNNWKNFLENIDFKSQIDQQFYDKEFNPVRRYFDICDFFIHPDKYTIERIIFEFINGQCLGKLPKSCFNETFALEAAKAQSKIGSRIETEETQLTVFKKIIQSVIDLQKKIDSAIKI